MRTSYLIAGGLAVAALVWIGSGQLAPSEDAADATAPAAEAASAQPERALARVRARRSAAEPHTTRALVQGRTESSRHVELRAQTEGRIVEIGAEEGTRVARGRLIVRIDTEDREARLKEAQARVEQFEIEFEAGTELRAKNFRAETAVAETRAELEAARAALERIQIDIGHTRIVAPFAATLADRPAEVGDFVQVGDPVGTLVDLDPILVVGDLSEQQVGQVATGTVARARLIDGREVEGIVRYVAPMSREATRTFRVELEIDNADYSIVEGLTASLVLPLDRIDAHRISPAAIGLDDAGLIGVKLLDAENRVRFAPVRIVAQDTGGLWVTGLDPEIVLITVGHEYVAVGEQVEPIFAGAPGGGNGGPNIAEEPAR